jgi:hypothetical protein
MRLAASGASVAVKRRAVVPVNTPIILSVYRPSAIVMAQKLRVEEGFCGVMLS